MRRDGQIGGTVTIFISHGGDDEERKVAEYMKLWIHANYPSVNVWSMADIPIGAGGGGVENWRAQLIINLGYAIGVIAIITRHTLRANRDWGVAREIAATLNCGKTAVPLFLLCERL